MSYVIPAPLQASVPVAGSVDTFPVHRIYCVGRNYVEHAKEMGHTGREAPFFFMKPADAVLPVPAGTTGELPYPAQTQDFQHEMELVVAIGKGGSDIGVADALNHVWGYAIGLDMTRRDVQGAAKKLGRPWETGKAFEHSAPIGPITPAAQAGDISHAAITLRVNDDLRQSSSVEMLIWNVAETIADLSTYFTLQPGDLIYTGTPAGVAAVQRGDELVGAIDGLGELRVQVV
ncbi:FAA hydrolase family protein [Janthinobacterium sp. BJB1]|uniref:fumarylacetoacetate hydrolase family protein n=1 Tax=Janthinobacterium sp. GW458P TaxID=1981504 RepID=UPI000A321994|nr:fumarylacetoacetate hydrolase family protein [Janthinobacterium sp. GW458P]MBE3023723.1 fumarylacetoacetate hydrolase family protein [Janthinobacterium sp. GW458P]PHV18622.1 FAA hydrolase family protein [Janthinobacterium sp. BJB303]PJC99435.1 FAA hydrolase family protein [Janthinobacterium sp. BJB1]